MTQIRHAVLVILAIVAAALTAVMVILATQNRALSATERLVQNFVAQADRIAAGGTLETSGAVTLKDPKS
jgi:hypothetical protein